jgi:hypothetical protein
MEVANKSSYMKKIFFITVLLAVLGLFVPKFAVAQTTQPVQTDYWVVDPEVTFVGKNAAHAGQLFDWTLSHYNWLCVSYTANGKCVNEIYPMMHFTYTYSVPLAFFISIIILIRTRVAPKQFVKKLALCTICIMGVYLFVFIVYQVADVLQEFFLHDNLPAHCPPACLSQKDLLYVGWSPDQFIGLRLTGSDHVESAWTTLALTKLTALTYYILVGALTIRKIMLWFIILLSPILVLLFLFKSFRNLGKLLVAECLLWIFYAPLLTLMLGIVSFLWHHGIPSYTTPHLTADQLFFPTSVNILLGGPGQFVTPTNSLNLPGTFILYVVSLSTLLLVSVLPWFMLRIVIDYAISYQKAPRTEQLP